MPTRGGGGGSAAFPGGQPGYGSVPTSGGNTAFSGGGGGGGGMNGPGGNANGNAAGAGGANQNNQQAGVNDAGSAGGGGGGGNMSTAVEEFFVAHSGGPASSANQFGFGGGGGGGAGDEASSYGDGHGGAGGFGAGGGGGGNGSGGAGGFGGGGGGGGSSGGPNFGTSVFAGGYGGVMTSNSQGIVGSAGGGGAGLGGGIFVNAGLLVLNNCTLTGNSAQGGQAGAGGAQPRASSGAGLAAAVFLLNAPTFITSCTISGNTSSSGGSQVYSLNMGKGSSSTVTLSNTVVGQSGPSAGPDVVIKAIRGGDLPRIRGVNNFVTNPGLIPKSILVGTGDPLLRPLADNGGPTQTMLPMPGSPLLDAGHNAPRGGLAATDQRGQIRLVNAFADIGSVETAGAARPFLREVAVRGTPQLPLRTIVLTFSGPLTAEPGAFRLSRPNGTGVIPVQVREVTRNGYTVVSLIVPAPLAKRTGSFKLVVDGEHLSDANGDPLFALTQERTLSVRSGRV